MSRSQKFTAKMVLLSVGLNIAVTLLILSLAGVFAPGAASVEKDIATDNTVASRQATSKAAAISSDGSDSDTNSRVVEVVNRARQAVVSIVISKQVPVIKQFLTRGPFGFNRIVSQQTGVRWQKIGAGSGFFVSSSGLIVTNKHVVSNRQATYTAVLANGKTYELEVIGRDPFLDIAVLRVKNKQAGPFPALEFADSTDLQVGQKVIAIGNALGQFQNTVSLGIISGLGRSIIAGGHSGRPQRLAQVIQTDAAINPGNSGGPLLNLAGKVVGVNVAVARGSENIGFAIPSSLVQEVVQSVKRYGEIVRPFLGIRYVPITDAIAAARDLSVSYGVLVIGGPGNPAVQPGSAADRAGIRAGDIILSIAGQKISTRVNVGAIIRSFDVGDTIELTLLRDGQRKTVSVTLQPLPESLY